MSNENKPFSEQDVPTMLNRETGKYEPLFTVHTEKKQEGPVIIEHVSVVVPAEINDFLMNNDITTLDLGNSEHVKRLAIYYDFYTETMTTPKEEPSAKEPDLTKAGQPEESEVAETARKAEAKTPAKKSSSVKSKKKKTAKKHS